MLLVPISYSYYTYYYHDNYQATKDARPSTANAELLTTHAGDAQMVVKTGDLETFATLFDLTAFDSKTLSKVQSLTVVSE